VKKRISLAALMIAVGLLAGGSPLHAADKNSQFGMLYGFSVPDVDNTNAFHVFGVKGEAFLAPQFSVGGYYLVSDKSGQKSDDEKFNYSLHGVQAAYHIAASNGDTFIAFRIGLSKIRQTQSNQDLIFSPYHYGIATGYDFYLTSYLSMGFEGSYLHVLKDRNLSGSVEYDQKSFNIINFLVSLQLRL
jgi:hypothetical protein